MNNIPDNSNNLVGFDMRKGFVKKIKQTLEKEKAELLARIEKHSKTEVDSGSSEDTDQIQARILNMAANQLAARDKEKCIRIDAALKRIENGIYGICGACGEDIGEPRLTIAPHAATCISCSEMNEIRKKRGY